MENEIVHELLHVEVEHLQRRYKHLLDKPPNHAVQANSNNQCSNESGVSKGNKVIESNVQNPELNNDTPPFNKVLSCKVELTKIRN